MNKHTKNSKPLFEDIKRFGRQKYGLAIILVIFGVLGLILPIIPGIALLLLAVGLFKKNWLTAVRRRMKNWDY
ncbi:MAG: hypothetical protein GF313_04105 [Caldithrix sp.]|nr:hypothetical protein [Caldithrix sp.]